MLSDLLTTLSTVGALAPSRAKDCKTSLRYLAAALGQPSLEQCPVGATCGEEATWLAALDAHFAALTAQGTPISAATRRNTRNNLRVVFRLAEARGLLPVSLPPVLLTPARRSVVERQQLETSPYKATYHPTGTPRYFGLHETQWPPEVQAAWRAYQEACGFRLRDTTLRTYVRRLTTYLGYVATICGREVQWDDLFDVATLRAFVRWHGARLGRHTTVTGQAVLTQVAAMAKVLDHPHAAALASLRNGFQAPAPLHIKRAHWISLAQLEAVADACLAEGRTPAIIRRRTRYPGGRRALAFQRGVILKILVRVPLRQRNIREMRVGEHLYKDQDGDWQLLFQGGDLKIGTRGGRVSKYDLNLSRDTDGFVPVLEEFLTQHRPHLPQAEALPYCFLTHRGNAFTQTALRDELAYVVARYTGQRFYPHLIRTIWATEFLKDTGDFTAAAVRLGDTVAMTMKTYHDVVRTEYHAKAKAFLATALKG